LLHLSQHGGTYSSPRLKCFERPNPPHISLKKEAFSITTISFPIIPPEGEGRPESQTEIAIPRAISA
jgi:hypothetical protein